MKKLNKVLSVLLTLAIVASMFVVAAPVSASVTPAYTPMTAQKWVKGEVPATDTFVVSDGESQIGDVIKLVYNNDETVIYAIADYNGFNSLFKTENEARTWELVWDGKTKGEVLDVTVSNNDADTVIIAVEDLDGYYKVCVNRYAGEAGEWIKQIAPVGLIGKITTIAYIAVGGTEHVYVGTEAGSVFELELTYGDGQWSDTQANGEGGAGFEHIYELKTIESDFGTNYGIMALVENSEGNVAISKRFNKEAWGARLPNVNTDIDGVVDATMWLPDDYEVMATDSALYIGVIGGSYGLWYVDPAAYDEEEGVATDSKITFGSIKYNINNITGYGDAEDPVLILGAQSLDTGKAVVLRTDSGLEDFKEATTNPNGKIAYVLLLSDYEANGKALAGTTGDEFSGVYRSDDSCENFIKVSLMFNHFEGLVDVADIYYLTSNGALWRFNNGYWEILKEELDPAKLYVAADGSIWMLSDDDSYISDSMLVSTDKGLTFKPYDGCKPGHEMATIVKFYPIDNNNYVAILGDGALVYKINGKSGEYTEAKAKVGEFVDFDYVDGVCYLLANDSDIDSTFTALSSLDFKEWTVEKQGTATNIDLLPNVIAFNGKEVKLSNGIDVVADKDGAGLESEGYGVVYTLTDDGLVTRRLGNHFKAIESLTYVEYGADVQDFSKIWLTKDGNANVIHAIAADGIYTYTDKLNTNGTGLTSAISGTKGSYTATITWDALDNVGLYAICVSDKAANATLASYTDIYFSTDTKLAISKLGPNKTLYYNVWAFTAGNNSLIKIGKDDQKFNSWESVTCLDAKFDNVISFAYGTKALSFTTPLQAPYITTPYVGETYVQAENCQITWTASATQVGDNYWAWYNDPNASAEGYKVQIVEITSNNIVADIETAPVVTIEGKDNTAYAAKDLKAGTAYAVRVCAYKNGVDGEWSGIVTFTTAPKAAEGKDNTIVVTDSQYTITVPAGDKVVVTETQQTTTLEIPEATTPIYVYIIIAIGAILCIAVIVLIVRTRRVA